MKFSPYTIKSQEFNKSLRGYDPDEVKIFLDRLSEWFGVVQTENEELKKNLAEAEKKILEFNRIEKNLQKALINAQESANSAKEEARKHTAIIVEEATLKSSEIIQKAKNKELEIRKEISELESEKTLLLSKLAAVVKTQARLLGMDEELETLNFTRTQESKIEKKKSNIDPEKIVEKLL